LGEKRLVFLGRRGVKGKKKGILGFAATFQRREGGKMGQVKRKTWSSKTEPFLLKKETCEKKVRNGKRGSHVGKRKIKRRAGG